MNRSSDPLDRPAEESQTEIASAALPSGSVEAVTHTRQARSLGGRRIASATLVVMFFFVLSRVTGLLREMIIGAQFGTSAELDAYLAAFRIPDLLFQLVAGGALGSAFIPTFSQMWTEKGEARAWQLFSRVLNLVTVLLVVLAGLAAIFAHPLVEGIIAPGFEPAQQALTAQLMRWMLISTVVFGASGLFMGALNAVQHFALPAAAPILYNMAIILGAWLLAPVYGIYGLVIGVVGGALCHFGIQIPGLVAQKARYRVDFTWRDPAVREVARLMGPRVLGLFFVQLNFLVNTILASQLAEGSLAALNYAWMLMLLPQGIFAQAIATVAFPTFAAQIAARDQGALLRTLDNTLRTVLFLTLPAAVGLYVLRVPLIQILLERGNFTAESTTAVAYALQFFALGLIAHALVEIIVRVFYALHNTLTPVIIGVGAMLLNILLSLWWISWLSYGGLALANSVATGVEMFVLLALLGRRLGALPLRSLLICALRSGLAAGAMGIAVWAWLNWLASHPQPVFALPTGWLSALGGFAIALITYAGVSFALGAEELRAVIDPLRRRLINR
ncbi:MAG: murein biosynthesis integral membrane protein MurJ [Caldilineaceae bacterium]|nr:murein biosynthesis integral membrane protein MurJ [Caldilineaceae bacterium]